MKKMLGVIGIGLIFGAFVHVFSKIRKKTMDNAATVVKKDDTDISADNSVSIINPNDIHGDRIEFGDVKSSAISNMSTRHEEASKIMKDAVEIICKRSEVSEDENCELEQISDELDELLRGE